MDVGRGDLARPHQADVVAGALGDRGDQPGDAYAVGAHGDRDQLAVLVEHTQPERVGVLPAELEDVADLDAARGLELTTAPRARVARPDLGSLDRAVGGEVATGDEVDDVVALLVGPGDPPGALD